MNSNPLITDIPHNKQTWIDLNEIIQILQLDVIILRDKVKRISSFEIQSNPAEITFLDVCAILESYLNPSIQKLEIKNVLQEHLRGPFNDEPNETVDFKLHLIKGDLTYEPPEGCLQLKSFEDNFPKTHPIKAYYKENLFIVNYRFTLDWKSIFKINAFKYRLMEEYYAHQNITLDSRLSIFYRALINDDLATVNTALNEILKNPKLKAMRYDKFKKHFKPDTSRQLKQIESSIRSAELTQSHILDQYADNINLIKSLQSDYEILLNKSTKDVSEEVIKYLTKHPYINNIYSINHHKLAIYYESPILYYDEQIAKKFMNNSKGAKQLLLQILYEKKYTLYTRCRINFDTESFKINTQEIGHSLFLYGHPHIDQYHCLGNHPKEIKKWIQEQDYIGAFDQITAATLNLNLTDSVVINGFITMLQGYPNIPSFKENSTGNFISFNDIKEKMKEENK